MSGTPITVLMVDDDKGDVDLTMAALEETKLANEFFTVGDGIECMRFLRQEGEYAGSPRPDVILLDLNMPRMNGLETLAAIRADPALRTIPVVVLTTSAADEDVVKSYTLSANCYVTKPVDLDRFMYVVQKIEEFWVQVVRLPPHA